MGQRILNLAKMLSGNMSAGKGDKPRAVDPKKYAANYEKIFRKLKQYQCSREKCCNAEACNEIGFCIQKIS